ncbi:MAG TPA: GNAT family N-acetyltransferase [Candidatus Binataceae bacterium]|nr:GNAT family N-acetyltransferase [Candidatus Binataceae bacterium]
MASDCAQRATCYELRRQVFVLEQGIDPSLERDVHDAQALHLLALRGELPVGCARALFSAARVKFGRMAVVRAARRQGVGHALLCRLLQIARQRGARYAYLNAQLGVERFYARQGFSPIGDVFIEAGIPHRRMELRLD